ncbi:MAG: hypothetical protein AAF739_01460 [Pseudomonadota bacterium]
MFRAGFGGSGGGLMGVMQSVTSLVAIAGTVFIAPLIWPIIEAPVMGALTDLYGRANAQWLGWLILILTYPISFSLIRAGLMGVLMAVSAYASNRLI